MATIRATGMGLMASIAILTGCARADDAAKPTTAAEQAARTTSTAPQEAGVLRMQLRGLSNIPAVPEQRAQPRRWTTDASGPPPSPVQQAERSTAADDPGSARERLIRVLSGRSAPVPLGERVESPTREPPAARQASTTPAEPTPRQVPEASVPQTQTTERPPARTKPSYTMNDLF